MIGIAIITGNKRLDNLPAKLLSNYSKETRVIHRAATAQKTLKYMLVQRIELLQYIVVYDTIKRSISIPNQGKETMRPPIIARSWVGLMLLWNFISINMIANPAMNKSKAAVKAIRFG